MFNITAMTMLIQSWVAISPLPISSYIFLCLPISSYISPLPIGQSALTAVCRVRTHCSDYCRLVSDVTRPLCPVQPRFNKPAVLNSRWRFSTLCFLKRPTIHQSTFIQHFISIDYRNQSWMNFSVDTANSQSHLNFEKYAAKSKSDYPLWTHGDAR